MKKIYSKPNVELFYLFSRDIITRSPWDGFVGDSDEEFKGGDVIIIG